MKRFGAITHSNKVFMTGFLSDIIRLSIYAQLDKQNKDLKNLQDIVKRAINAKAKVSP